MKYSLLEDKESQSLGEHGRRLRRVTRATLVVLSGISISFLLLFLSRWGWPAPPHTPMLSLDELRNGTYLPALEPIQWIPNGKNGSVLLRRQQGFMVKNWGSHNKEKFVSNNSIPDANGVYSPVSRLQLNADQSKALLFVNQKKHWRHSTVQEAHILDVESQKRKLVSENVSIAKWRPDGQEIAYVKDSNVFLYDVVNDESVQLTFDGGKDGVFNGVPDWVYEEEVFQNDNAVWYSGSGNALAFLRTNDSSVNEFLIPYFVQGSEKAQHPPAYPEVLSLRYPKPGFTNPEVELIVARNRSLSSVKINTDLLDPIYSEVFFVGEQLVVKVTDREADKLEVWVANTNADGEIVAELARTTSTAWSELTHHAVAVGDGYIDTIDVDGWRHLGLFSPATNSTPVVLTSGEWEVSDAPVGVQNNSDLYFTGSLDSSREKTLLHVSLSNPLNVSKVAYMGPGVYDVEFSGDASFATVVYYPPDKPLVQKVVLLNREHSKRWVLQENLQLKELLESRGLIESGGEPLVVYGNVTLANNVTVNYREIRPSKFSKHTKHPLLFFNYGGPGSQLVTERFGIDFQRVYAEQHNAVVVTVDPRGTGQRGREFRELVRDRLGELEAEDVIYAGKEWNSRSYIDESRTALWGWSYGGFLTLKVLERDVEGVFKLGAAVAPVTDWELYDSVYTERYMHRPSNNRKGYDRSAIQNVTALGEHQRFLVMHGTGDDNVHFQNTLSLLDKLDVGGIENYDVHVFPDSDHSIQHHNANTMVYDRLDSWLTQHTRRRRFGGGR